MNSKQIASLALLASLSTTLPAWADTSIPNGTCPATLTGDVTIEDCGALTVSSSIALAGHKLTLKGVTSVKWGSGATFTSTGDTTGELWIEHSGAVTQTTAFSGNLKFIKDGAGTWTLPKVSSYSGGTEVRGGRLVGNTSSTRNFQSTMMPFGTGSNLDVYGGTLECKGYAKWDYKNFCVSLYGGTFENTAQQDNTTAFNASLNVFADSDFSLANKKIYNIAGAVDLKGNTLRVQLTSTLRFNPTSVSAGTISVTGTGKSFQIENDLAISGVNLDMAATLALNGKTLEINDFVLESTGAVSGEGNLYVHGTYKPAAVDAYWPVMAGGSTLDLSGLSEAVELGTENFDSGTVTIALGARELTANQQIVKWDAKPANVTFAFTGDNIAEGKTFTVSESGIVYDAKSDTVSSAIWTGKGEAGNWTDPDNWECRNASAQIVEGKCPPADLTVTFTGDVASVTFDGTFPFAGARFTDASLSTGSDWSGFDLEKLSDDSLLDLGGHALTLSATNGISSSKATFTNSAALVALNFVVGDGAVYTNATLNFSGNLGLVKKGAGTLVATKYPQLYTGTTTVEAGGVRCGDKADLDLVSGASPFGAACELTLEAGTFLDPAGSCNWSSHTINMNGGVISNTVAELGRGTSYNSLAKNPFNPTLNLHASAVLSATADFNFQGTVVVSGESDTLEVNVAPGKEVFWNPVSSTGLHLTLTGGGDFGVWQRNPVTGAKSTNVTLEVTDANLCLYYYEKGTTVYAGGMDVVRYISSCANVDNDGSAALTVSGIFTPDADCFYGCTMADGSKIDLSGKTAAWSTTSLAKNNNTVKFADGATVTLDVGSRTLTLGEQVLAWTTKPLDATFVFAGENVDPAVPVVCGVDGIAYGYAKEPEIVWSGKAGNGDLTDPANWEGGVVPTTVKATLTGDVSNLNVPVGKSFAAEKIWFKEATLSQNADFSWLDINRVTDESILDLCGHDLALACTDGVCTNAGTVTDSAVAGGTVSFSVAENCVYTNKHFSFSGSLNFVKTGAGLLVAEKYPQTYEGTTAIAAGGIRCGEKADLDEQSGLSPFGATCTVTVNDGAYLDPAGSYNWNAHTIVLDGGLISNTVEQAGLSNESYNAAKTAFLWPFDPSIVLQQDALLVALGKFNFRGELVSNGHRMTVDMSSDFRWFPNRGTKAQNATVEFTGAGALRLLKNFPFGEPTMTLVMNGAKFDLGGSFAVSNYVALSETTVSETRNNNDMHFDVYGTFTPATNDFIGCTLQDGSTLDLSQKTGAWSVLRREDLKSTNTYDYVSFADNATVTLDVGTRTVRASVPVVSWTEVTKPANLATLNFVLNDEAVENLYKIRIADDGIYLKRDGFVLSIQ